MSTWEINKHNWDKIALKAKNAVVYMDSKLGELLHWNGGIDNLLRAGAVDIRDFSSFEVGHESQKKAVFIISSPLSGVSETIIQDVVRASSFQYVVVITTASLQVHAEGSGTDAESCTVFEDFEDALREWMGNVSYTAEVLHSPVFAADVSPGLFITPAFSDLFPLLPSDMRQLVYQLTSNSGKDRKVPGSIDEVECNHLPVPLQLQFKLLASGFHSLLAGLDIKEDIYYIGNSSRILASELDQYPPAKTRRKTAQKRASLLFLDRSLDIATVVSHQMDTLMDRLMNTLPPLHGHSSDRMLDMHDLCVVHRNPDAESVILPGSLAPSAALTDQPNHLTSLFLKKQKEALMEVNKRLVETASAEKLPLNLSGRPNRITPEQLDSTISLFRGKYDLILKHLDMLQVAVATSQTLKNNNGGIIENTLAQEKNLIQSVSEKDDDVSPTAVSVLSRLILQELEKHDNERIFNTDNILGLVLFLYAISDGDIDEDEAAILKENFTKLVVKDKDNLSVIVSQIVGDKVNENILSEQLETVWEKLDDISTSRIDLNQFSSVIDPGDTMTPASLKPILRQIVEKVIDPAHPELTDIVYKSGGLKDFLKSGFGLFKGSSKPSLGDAPLLIIFVIGGITPAELKNVTDVVNKTKPDFQVVLGSTKLSTIESTMDALFVRDNINLENI